MTKRFEATATLINALKEVVAEQEVFNQNGVRITVRTAVRAPEAAAFMVSWKDNGETAYRSFGYIEQALDFAEEKQC